MQLDITMQLKMDFNAWASTWMPSPLWWPAVALTFNLQNLIRSSVEG